MFDRLELPGLARTSIRRFYDHRPEVVAAFRRRGDQVVCQGRTNSEHQNDFDEAGEARLVCEVTEAITRSRASPHAAG